MKRNKREWAVYQRAVHDLRASLGREVTPHDLYEDFTRRGRKSPFWSYFEKDQTKAYKAYLLWQARELLGKLYVLYPDDSGKSVQTREYVQLNPTSDKSAYIPRPEVDSNAGLLQQVIHRAAQELDEWVMRYRTFFGPVPKIKPPLNLVRRAISSLQKIRIRRAKKKP